VHFSEEQAGTHNAEIEVKYESGDHVDIHLGFLKIKHRYRITFCVKDSLGDKITADENENITMVESVPNEEGILLYSITAVVNETVTMMYSLFFLQYFLFFSLLVNLVTVS